MSAVARTTQRVSAAGSSAYAVSPTKSAICAASSRARFCRGVAESRSSGVRQARRASAACRFDVGRKRCDSSTTMPSNEPAGIVPRLSDSCVAVAQGTPARRIAPSHVERSDAGMTTSGRFHSRAIASAT